MNKTVLMICYYYPPLITSGASRSLNFSLLLSQNNWNPLIMTASKHKDPWVKKGTMPKLNVEIIKTPEFNLTGICDFFHGSFCKLASIVGLELKTNYFRELLFIPDGQITWFTTFKAFLIRKRYNIIYVTCSPFSSAISGVCLKILTNKPLVVDFRDPFTLNPYTKVSFLKKIINEWLERIILKFTDALILNTPGALGEYSNKHQQHINKLFCIPNGYDLLTPVSLETYRASLKDYTIVHVGTFYGTRSPRAILEAISKLPKPRPKFLQVGENHSDFELFSHEVDITITGVIPREDAIKKMCSASLLYLKQGIESEVKNYTSIAAKTYEYLATGLPILVDAPNGDNTEIVKKYAKHSWIVTSGEVNDLAEALNDALRNKDQINPHISEDYVKKFSRENLTKELSALFNQLTK